MSANETGTLLRHLPAVDELLHTGMGGELCARYGHPLTVAVCRQVISSVRKEALAAGAFPCDADALADYILGQAAGVLDAGEASRLVATINATGIVLHTGQGRAPMPQAAADALAGRVGTCTVQMDLETGARTQREHVIRDLVCELTGAEDCLLVNNNAGATWLVLRALAAGREVVISRGELIEIGGSFRLPDIMSESGAILREVGATNKTHPHDYADAINDQTALLLKAHKSNYRIVGFSQDVDIGEIARIGHEAGLPVVDDLGCGALVDLAVYGLEHECTVQESLVAGADVALMSTDKLIGGPQGGLIVGRADLLARIRKCPLYRVLRVGKLTLAAVEATLRLFRDPDRLRETHPVYAMLGRDADAVRSDAEHVKRCLEEAGATVDIALVADDSFLGGGSLPGVPLPSTAVGLSVEGVSADALARALRTGTVPVVGRVQDDRVLLNMRTVPPADIPRLIESIQSVTDVLSADHMA